LISTIFILSCSQEKSWIEPFPLFSDHMVLQRDTTVAIWGWGNPGSTVSVSSSWGESNKGVADKSGKWITELKTIEAGGPHTLSLSNTDTVIVFQDVMLGEVWIASGQSNMSMPLKGWPPNDLILNSEKEILESTYPEMRMFTVQRALSDSPQTSVIGNWQVSSPETSGDFSATAYFFSRELHQTLQVPVGIIHTSWGGTPAESWTSSGTLKESDDFSGVIEQLEKDKPKRVELAEWFDSLDKIPIALGDSVDSWIALSMGDEHFFEEGFNDSRWREMNLPLAIEQSEVGNFDGAIWFRKKIVLEEMIQGAVLHLGAIDDRDQTYVNGALVGEHMDAGQWQIEREYEIPDGILKKGENIIAVRVLDTGGGGGIFLPDYNLEIRSEGNTIDLGGAWKYKLIAEYRENNFYIYTDTKLLQRPEVSIDLNSHTPSVLYNAMIHPLVPFTIKGAIWYQGESNVGRAEQYETLFPSMIQDWRLKWGDDFSFYYVQIAPFNYGRNGILSAELRNAQRKSMSLKGTGMAVTMDIGMNKNIHPGNKQDVGKRLAFWALSKDYVQNSNAGPVVDKMEREGKHAVVYFNQTGEGLELREPQDNFEVSSDGEYYVTANVAVMNDKLRLTSSQLENILFVRYAWKDTAQATLFNSFGLPASSFQLQAE